MWAVTEGGGSEGERAQGGEIGRPTLLALLVQDLENGIAAAA